MAKRKSSNTTRKGPSSPSIDLLDGVGRVSSSRTLNPGGSRDLTRLAVGSQSRTTPLSFGSPSRKGSQTSTKSSNGSSWANLLGSTSSSGISDLIGGGGLLSAGLDYLTGGIASLFGGGSEQISTNDATTLTITLPWTTVPDHTSQFVVSESAWKFAAVSATTPAKFQIPYRAGSVLQITGRAANVLDQESSPDLSPLTRVSLGNQEPDFGVPAPPAFVLDAPGAGELTLSAVGFADLTNVGSVTSGTLSIYFIDELSPFSGYILASPLDTDSRTLVLGHVSGEMVGSNFQIGTELVYVLGVDVSAGSCTVVRGVLNSTVAAHATGEALSIVRRSVAVVPFATNFFQNRASVNYLHSLQLPDIRVVAAEFFVTNSFGDSQVQQQCYTQVASRGLRTLSGGQLSLQANGSLVTQLNAAPPLMVQADHAVRDVRADLGRAAQGYKVAVTLLQAGQDYCTLQIGPNDIESQILDGVDLPAVKKLGSLTMNISLQLIDGYQGTPIPPRDVTVTIRF